MELVDLLIDSVAGWRYLLSRTFRYKTHARWKTEGKVKMFGDIAFGAAPVLFPISSFGYWSTRCFNR
jgi:hypothetical protein